MDLLETYIENREMVQPNHANSLQTAHGGNVLKWMDEIGAMSAMRFAGESCVTAHINGVDFERPIQVGDIALIEAYVYAAGETSVRVRLQTSREDIRTGEAERTTESYFVYVAIDGDRTPTPVPELTVEDERGERLREAALAGENGRR
ncbi:acyl-CoA thioesterase [Halalkalicoccus jeotgali]|uniref:Thioesterase superfamily protein n=1 Tax=Halalkalicoccus jeotgali (strain DSM 18796 / CECT 7217 / JCM 14584 / KCTC 4019 / B3) TaxID=795797 RepID=D8J4R7_HALJB|nr:acyl-CoA thioesterase [Halalkalicoccus jeotgali]ADJ15534.1 thioesterase superfamily protein [Halalkalicoccus jeotgali B3]ELY36057.1 thioesterase superfamily protein [Halalkalicoccus jeotgali B3]